MILLGDIARILSVLFLWYRVQMQKSTNGVCIETQELYFTVFLCRYLEIFVNYTYLSWQSMRKLFLLSFTFHTLLGLYKDGKARTNQNDGVITSYITIFFPFLSVTLATVLYESTPFRPSAIEFLFTFSFYLEIIALVPQLSTMFKSETLPILLDTNTDEEPVAVSHVSDSVFDNQQSGPNNIHIYIYLVLVFRICYLLDWAIQIIFPDCFDDAFIPLDLIIPCTTREPLNLHHLVIYICGLLQTLIILACVLFSERIAQSSAVARYNAWRQRGRGRS